MHYTIECTFRFSYGVPSGFARILVHLLPPDLPGAQRVLARALEVTPRPGERRDGADFFGNAQVALAFHEPVEHIAVTLRAQVDRLAPAAAMDLSPRLSGLAGEIAAQRTLAPHAPHHFLGASSRIAPCAAIEDFARAALVPGMTAQQAVVAVGEALHAAMRFDAEATDVHTPAAEAFAARHGVCQDFTHIMITGLRALGVPAGYVSGFLRTEPPAGQPRLEGADAMHAWVSAWCGSETGWIEYDPTNATPVGQDHVVVAYGRDYADVAPVRGAVRTSGLQTGSHSVDMVPATETPKGGRP